MSRSTPLSRSGFRATTATAASTAPRRSPTERHAAGEILPHRRAQVTEPDHLSGGQVLQALPRVAPPQHQGSSQQTHGLSWWAGHGLLADALGRCGITASHQDTGAAYPPATRSAEALVAPSHRRSRATRVCSAARPPSGGWPPQTASTSRSTETGLPRRGPAHRPGAAVLPPTPAPTDLRRRRAEAGAAPALPPTGQDPAWAYEGLPVRRSSAGAPVEVDPGAAAGRDRQASGR